VSKTSREVSFVRAVSSEGQNQRGGGFGEKENEPIKAYENVIKK
jgi:hypothetical protein